MWIGIDVGGTKALAVAVDDRNQVLATRRAATPPGADQLEALLVALVDGVARDAGGPPHAVGVGIAGLIDRAGVVRYSPHLPGVVDFPLSARLAAALGVAVSVDNDLTVAALAEARHGAGRGFDHVVVVALGTGIGTKLVQRGEVVLGAHGFAGEAGHMTIDRRAAVPVSGVAGAWEMFASGTALTAMLRERAGRGELARLTELAGAPDAIDSSHLRQAIAEGDAPTLAALDDYAEAVAVGIGSLINVVDPDVFVLAGGVSSLGEPLRSRIEPRVARWVVGARHRAAVPIRLAELGEDAGALGAAWRGRDRSRAPQ